MNKLLALALTLAFIATPVFAMPPQGGGAIRGKITETMESGGYTYMKIKSASGDVWAAVPSTQVKVGQDVTIDSPMMMHDFESKTLNRKFAEIAFGTLDGETGAAPAKMGGKPSNPFLASAKQPKMPSTMSQPHGSPAPAINLAELNVSKAPGSSGKTVAEVYGEKTKLKGKQVAVRGQVTKASFGIMGKNWLHISDGTGKVEDNNFDLTVTTASEAKVGDVVLIKGKLSTDKDVGAGYFYPVIIEDAKLEN